MINKEIFEFDFGKMILYYSENENKEVRARVLILPNSVKDVSLIEKDVIDLIESENCQLLEQ